MGKVILNDTTLTNIADAIRNKNGETNTYLPSEMAQKIIDIPTGGEDLQISNGLNGGQDNNTIISETMNNIDNLQDDYIFLIDNLVEGGGTSVFTKLSGKRIKVGSAFQAFNKATSSNYKSYTLDFSTWDFSRCGNFKLAFGNTSSVLNISTNTLKTLRNANFGNAIIMKQCFYNCKNIDNEVMKIIQDFDLRKVVNLYEGFNNITSASFTELDFSKFNFRDLKTIAYAFSGCTYLQKVTMSQELILEKIEPAGLDYLFSNNQRLEEVDLSKLKGNYHPEYGEHGIVANYIVNACVKLKKLTLPTLISASTFSATFDLTYSDSLTNFCELTFAPGSWFGCQGTTMTTATFTLDLSKIWKGTKNAESYDYEHSIGYFFDKFLDSLSPTKSDKPAIIKLYSDLYNSLEDSDFEKATQKGYTLSK